MDQRATREPSYPEHYRAFEQIVVPFREAIPSNDQQVWLAWALAAKRACAVSQHLHFAVAAARGEERQKMAKQVRDLFDTFVYHAMRLLEKQPKPRFREAGDLENYAIKIDHRLVNINQFIA